ncbi:hypothetical protein ACFFTN_21015 [Aminobacter aganoensis]|uniref:Uncharacterized protein n=1 Tax=Aminobacter aganoensis TaxID=83264 RepID=A0A7X0KN98_9HYPH|nr:hypothetical protein [Aminobacter aganoensis]MBB6356952.1 hypothetical protein [Aminobacter aganoensis]
MATDNGFMDMLNGVNGLPFAPAPGLSSPSQGLLGILSNLFRGPQNTGQFAQTPGNGPGLGPNSFPPPPGLRAQTPKSGFSRFLDTDIALPVAGALLGNQGNAANLGNAFSAAAPAIKRNKTLEYLQQNDPELAKLVGLGLEPRDALGLLLDKRKAQKPNLINAGDGRLYNADTSEWITAPNAGMDDYSQRQRAAEQYGLTPDDPRYQSFLLTGKMPREDAQPLTATDKKAILEADEMVQVTDTAMPLLDRALELNNQAYSGPMAGTRGYISGTFGSDAGQATMEYDNLVQQQALATLKATFGAAPTEGERKILLEIAGSSSQPPEVRRGILERAKQAVARRQQFYRERATEMRGGSFYKPGGGVSGQGGGNRTGTGVQWSVEP